MTKYSKPYDGGPAFPQLDILTGERDGHGDAIEAYTLASGGATLRDWFASSAPVIPEWWMNDGCPTPPPGWSEGDGPNAWDMAVNKFRMSRLVTWQLAYADAMLAARDERAKP